MNQSSKYKWYEIIRKYLKPKIIYVIIKDEQVYKTLTIPKRENYRVIRRRQQYVFIIKCYDEKLLRQDRIL